MTPHATEQACVLQLLSLCSRAQEPQLLKPVCLDSVLQNKRRQGNEKPVHRKEEWPPPAVIEKAHMRQQTRCTQK